jgi:DNA invertase Pin-like site-specific DNA recombinase
MGMDMERLTKDERETAIAMYNKGMTVDEIIFGLNLTESQVKYIIRYYKGPKRKYKKRVPSEVSIQILEMYEAGLKPWLIAKKLGVPATSVYSIAGYQRRKEFYFLREK